MAKKVVKVPVHRKSRFSVKTKKVFKFIAKAAYEVLIGLIIAAIDKYLLR